jgi:hypothetical protein
MSSFCRGSLPIASTSVIGDIVTRLGTLLLLTGSRPNIEKLQIGNIRTQGFCHDCATALYSSSIDNERKIRAGWGCFSNETGGAGRYSFARNWSWSITSTLEAMPPLVMALLTLGDDSYDFRF